MDLDIGISGVGLLVGFCVGLTGMGGGALMTPILVLFFKVSPLAAVSSDLLASLVMKPVGGAVHARRGTVRRDLVMWLCVGSVPAAFAGVLVLNALGQNDVDELLRRALGIALITASLAMVLKAWLQWKRERAPELPEQELKRGLTVAIGVLGGLVVGMTSVGSGSLVIVLLMFAYPGLSSAQLVGTDLLQAIPLVGAATLGHLLFGDVRFGLTASLLVGALPGVYVGARVSARANDNVVRSALFLVLFTSGLKLVGAF